MSTMADKNHHLHGRDAGPRVARWNVWFRLNQPDTRLSKIERSNTRTPLARIILSSLRGARRGHGLDVRLDRIEARQALQLARLDTLTAVI